MATKKSKSIILFLILLVLLPIANAFILDFNNALGDNNFIPKPIVKPLIFDLIEATFYIEPCPRDGTTSIDFIYGANYSYDGTTCEIISGPIYDDGNGTTDTLRVNYKCYFNATPLDDQYLTGYMISPGWIGNACRLIPKDYKVVDYIWRYNYNDDPMQMNCSLIITLPNATHYDENRHFVPPVYIYSEDDVDTTTNSLYFTYQFINYDGYSRKLFSELRYNDTDNVAVPEKQLCFYCSEGKLRTQNMDIPIDYLPWNEKYKMKIRAVDPDGNEIYRNTIFYLKIGGDVDYVLDAFDAEPISNTGNYVVSDEILLNYRYRNIGNVTAPGFIRVYMNNTLIGEKNITADELNTSYWGVMKLTIPSYVIPKYSYKDINLTVRVETREHTKDINETNNGLSKTIRLYDYCYRPDENRPQRIICFK